MSKIYMKCSCCGEFAGYWEQYHNQDTHWSVCKQCVGWIKRRGMSDEDFRTTYGEPGINYEAEETT